MSDVVIEATNNLDGRTYCASIVPKQQAVEYWLAPTLSAGDKERQSTLITLKATATARRIFAMSSPPLLIVCYGLGRLEFDAFCALVVQILSNCDLSALPSAPNRLAIDEICARHGVLADQGEFRSSRSSKPVTFLMLFDHHSTARGY